MSKYLSSPVQAFLAIVVILSCGIYGLSDYYLNSLGKEMMLDWAKTEALSIQDGYLLTSVTKSQPYLVSSNYIKGIQLLKSTDNQYQSRIALGIPFTPSPSGLENLGVLPVVSRVGFLHTQVFYRIPSRLDFVLVFDLSSPVLTYSFLAAVAILILLVLGLITVLRTVEAKESQKREKLLKLAISDLLVNDAATNLLEEQFPEVTDWWKTKKYELAEANRVAVENDSKIMLGEMASRLAHDIKNSIRNIRTLVNRTYGLNEGQTKNLQRSIGKIEAIASTISERTKGILVSEANRKCIVDMRDLIRKVVDEKNGATSRTVNVKFLSEREMECYLNPLEFERSFSNLIENAIDAKKKGPIDVITRSDSGTVEIAIVDTGKGISPANLRKIGIKGVTGKTGGTGLGVYYAKKLIEESGGQFKIQSAVGKGTTVSIVLPLVGEPPPTPTEMHLRAGMSLAILDDDPLVLDAVQDKLSSLMLKDSGVEYKLFQKSSDLESWLPGAGNDFLVVTDFNLTDETENGLDLIDRLNLGNQSWVFTSLPEDEVLRAKARRLGVPVVGKDVFFAMPFSVGV